MKKYSDKRKKAYAFRQFQRTIEKERKETEIKSSKPKEKIISGYGKITQQTISYKKLKVSRIVYRDSKGRFTKKPESKIIPIEEKKPEKRFFGDLPYYRASVFIEVPYHSCKKRGINNYYWFGVIQIDKEEKIDMKQLQEECIKMIEKELHCNRVNFWFEYESPSGIEYPKPYPASHPDKFYEKWSRTTH